MGAPTNGRTGIAVDLMPSEPLDETCGAVLVTVSIVSDEGTLDLTGPHRSGRLRMGGLHQGVGGQTARANEREASPQDDGWAHGRSRAARIPSSALCPSSRSRSASRVSGG